MPAPPGPRETSEPAQRPLSWGEAATAFGLLLGLALLLYDPGLYGPFLSDDRNYLSQNAYVRDLSPDSVVEVFDPSGQAAHLAMGYAPVHLLGHAVEWHFFADRVLGYHVVNVVLLALVSVLIAALFIDSGIPRVASLAAAVLFVVHPANVEAVAWISQLKSGLALVPALIALLIHRRHPLLGVLLFGLALLAKPSASFALPFLVIRDWSRDGFARWRWWLAWLAVLALYWTGARISFLHNVPVETPLHPDPFVLARTIATIGFRYIVMGASGYGVAAFHEPILALSPLDPWFLAAFVVLAAMGARAAHALWNRNEEAAYWIWALAAFVPISQIVPFLHPMGDRYLYFILPGLLGGGLLALEQWRGRLHTEPMRRGVAMAGFVGALGLAVLFGVQTHTRVGLWVSEQALMEDSAAHYPEGLYANLIRLQQAGARGDAAAATKALSAAHERGFASVFEVVMDPSLAPFRQDPGYQAVVDRMAGKWIERYEKLDRPTQLELRGLAIAYFASNDIPQAVSVLERALVLGGPFDAIVRADLENLRPVRNHRERNRGESGP